MVENNTLNNWIDLLKSQADDSPLLCMDLEKEGFLRVMEDDFIVLFNNLIAGKTYSFANLEESGSLTEAMNAYRRNNPFSSILFTNQFVRKQNETLFSIKEEADRSMKETSVTNAFLCFGLLRYSLNAFRDEFVRAPLVFVPVTLIYNEETDTYSITGINGEVFLNDPLIEKLKKARKVDLSYPVDSTFSVSDYIYYASLKVRPLNWTVQNYNLIANLNLSVFYNLRNIQEEKEKIMEKDMIRKMSYLNAEFLQFNKSKGTPLDSKYLAVLDMESDEYSILKRVAEKEPLLIHCSEEEKRNHLISNILLAYLLNNQRILVVYSDRQEKESLKKAIEENGYSRFVFDMDAESTDKKEAVRDLVNYNQYIVSRETSDNMLKETVRNYYVYKNTFKTMLNELRTKDNNLKTSVNKAVNQYFKYSSYPSIDAEIKDAYRFTPELLSRYVSAVREFASSIEELKCPIKEHPFYGLNKNQMKKEDYLPLKESATLLTTYLNDIDVLITIGKRKYSYPQVRNLKELKALLNILRFADEYRNDENIIDINDLDSQYDSLVRIQNHLINLNNEYNALNERFTRKVKFISKDLIDGCFNEKTSKKSRQKVKALLGRKISSDNLEYVIDKLSFYYSNLEENKELCDTLSPSLSIYLKQNRLPELRHIINSVNDYKNNYRYLQDKEGFDIHVLLHQKGNEQKMLRRALASIFNGILKNQSVLQEYFDPASFDFSTLSFDEFENKVSRMAKNFISVNDYTAFYIHQHELNTMVPHLADELTAKCPYGDFENSFLKSFYRNYIIQAVKSGNALQNVRKEDFMKILENFSSSDEKRKAIMNELITGYFDSYLRKRIVALRKEESSGLIQAVRKGVIPLPMQSLVSIARETIFRLKPCNMVSYRAAAYYLGKEDDYDAVLYLADDRMKMEDVLSTIYRGKHVIVFSSQEENISSLNTETSGTRDSFVSNVRASYPEVYAKSTEPLHPLQGNFYDKYLKASLVRELKGRGFEVELDRVIHDYTIDLLVHMHNARSSVAVIVDHLSYTSPENAYEIFRMEKDILDSLGYFSYRIIPADFVMNEEEELNALSDFIVKQSDFIPEIKPKTQKVLLMDHLFPLFTDPHYVYYRMDKSNRSVEDIVRTMIHECAPVHIRELDLIIKENTREIVHKMDIGREIEVENSFIFLPGRKVTFRRVDRKGPSFRPLEFVSDREIYDAVYQVVNYLQNISKDTLIKMILLSLGYKKINPSLYSKVEDCIHYLLGKKVIFSENDILYRDV